MLSIALVLASLLAPQDGITQQVEDICSRSAGIATAETIGTSRGGRPVLALTLAQRGGTPLADRPAVLIVAGAHGQHRLGTELALHHAEQLATAADERASAMLERCTVYIVPQLNPDGAELRRPGNAKAIDMDRDGALDEDPPNDLNGDGMISHMRWPSSKGTWVLDDDDPRLLRAADPEKGERGTHEIALEGRDDDGDEQRDEDPGHGLTLHRAFAHGFDSFDRSSGTLPMGEPEARALADFVFARPHIGMALVYGPENNLLGKPKTDPAKGRAILKGILEGDAALYASAGERYRALTGRKGDVADDHGGSVWSWLYFQVGVPTFASDVWSFPPAREKGTEPPAAETGEAAPPNPKKEAKGKKGKPNPDAARLAQCDLVGHGFVAWESFSHPDLGDVEIGGFVEGPGWGLIDAEAHAAALDAHHGFFVEVAGWLARCEIESLTSTPRGDGVYEVEATIVNGGRIAALSAISERTRRFATPRLHLDLGGGELVAGRTHLRADNLAGLGGRQEFRWIVTASPGTVLRLTLTTDFSGRDLSEVTL